MNRDDVRCDEQGRCTVWWTGTTYGVVNRDDVRCDEQGRCTVWWAGTTYGVVNRDDVRCDEQAERTVWWTGTTYGVMNRDDVRSDEQGQPHADSTATCPSCGVHFSTRSVSQECTVVSRRWIGKEAAMVLLVVLLQNLPSGTGVNHENPRDGGCPALDSNLLSSWYKFNRSLLLYQSVKCGWLLG
jgi:hypothetical protein